MSISQEYQLVSTLLGKVVLNESSILFMKHTVGWFEALQSEPATCKSSRRKMLFYAFRFSEWDVCTANTCLKRRVKKHIRCWHFWS